jgi:hypothetical protein
LQAFTIQALSWDFLQTKNEWIVTNLPNGALWTKKKMFEWLNLYNVHNIALPPNKEPISLSFALTHQFYIQQTQTQHLLQWKPIFFQS